MVEADAPLVDTAHDAPHQVQSKHARTEGKRTKIATAPSLYVDGPIKLGGKISFQKNPEFLKTRLEYFDELYAKQKAEFDALPRQPITITLPDGKQKEGTSCQTTPIDVAKMISNQLAKIVVVAKVRYPQGRMATLDEGLVNPEADAEKEGEGWMQWDATRPLEGHCDLQLFTFEAPEGRETFWHSSAHVLGETLEQEFGV